MVSDFRKKQKGDFTRKATLVLGGFLLVVCLILLVAANLRMYQKKQELDLQLKSLQAKVDGLHRRNAELKEGIANADNPAYIEKIAREELDLQKPGEKVISFVEPLKEAKEDDAKPKNIFQIWAAWIGGWMRR